LKHYIAKPSCHLGAIDPSRHWSAFDVSREDARKGKASKFVTTIWNYHSRPDGNGKRIPTGELAILRDGDDQTYWYRFVKPTDDGARIAHVAHWEGLNLALDLKLPIVGVLKDAETGKCSVDDVFDCANPQWAQDGETLWLNLLPRNAIQFEIGKINIRAVGERKGDAVKSWDLGNPIPSRVMTSSARIVRDTKLSKELKRLHAHSCQICGTKLEFTETVAYSEAHHIKPLGSPHNGPDIAENIIVLCPNHHALCDFRAIELSLDQIRLHPNHKISHEFIDYHNRNACNGG